MKKIVILAISAIFVANISAQEAKKVCFPGDSLTKEQRVELDIKRFTHELMLSDKQAEKFSTTYREYTDKLDELFQKNAPAKIEPGTVLTESELDKMAKDRFDGIKKFVDLQSKYYDKFRKFLSARQVNKVLRRDDPFGPKPCCGKHNGKQDGPRPECGKNHGHK